MGATEGPYGDYSAHFDIEKDKIGELGAYHAECHFTAFGLSCVIALSLQQELDDFSALFIVIDYEDLRFCPSLAHSFPRFRSRGR